MNDILIYSNIKLCLFILVIALLITVFLFKKKRKKIALLISALTLGFIGSIWVLYANEIKTLEAGYTFIDKNIVNKQYPGFFDEHFNQMTDFTYGHINDHERLVSLVIGENFVFAIDPQSNNGEPLKILCQKGKITVTLDDALDIIREVKSDYIITDVKYLFEEHTRVAFYQFRVKGDKNLMLSVNAITGELQKIYMGPKGVK